MKKNSLLVFTYFMVHCAAFCQENIPMATWRTHFSYNTPYWVEVDNGRVYAATKNSLFYYDNTDNSINKITALDGLSGGCISYLSVKQGILIIGYCSGIIDFIDDNQISTFKLLSTAPQLTERSIRAIGINNGKIYIGTSVGVVVIDNDTKNIVESYLEIGPLASRVVVNDIVFSEDSIFLASSKGILSASIGTRANLQDFRNWKQNPFFKSNIHQLIAINGKLLVNDNGKLLEYSRGSIKDLSSQLKGASLVAIKSLEARQLITSKDLQNNYYIQDENLTLLHTSSAPFNDAAIFNSDIYLASNGYGLLKTSNETTQSLLLEGPTTDKIVKLENVGGAIFAIPEYTNSTRKPLSNTFNTSNFKSGKWSDSNHDDFKPVSAISSNGVYWSSYGLGVLDTVASVIYDDDDGKSTLMSSLQLNSGVLIADLDIDSEGNLWVLNYDVNPSLHKLEIGGEWRSYALGTQAAARYPRSITISHKSNVIWITIDPIFGGGLVAYSAKDARAIALSRSGNNLPSTIINDIAIDLHDEVWLATSDGVAIFFTSDSPFIAGFDKATTPFLGNEPLLKNTNTTAIAIDGGNRKWVGSYEGLWLFSENGDEVIQHFTSKNSPLPSDTIVDVAINGISGEVFIATAAGLVSYRSDATIASSQPSKIKIFPNPVSYSYNGTLGIEGLANNALVKITDVSGRLVRELQANGGSASWDGRTLDGTKPAMGVYLIFSAKPDGSSSLVGKFAIIP